MGIYSRDNYAQLNASTLEQALARRQAAVDREAARNSANWELGRGLMKTLGRHANMALSNDPAAYMDDPDYRAARSDYILNGDRSGLDAFRRRAEAADAAKLNRIFQAEQAKLSREFQAEEAAKNRALQREQLDNEKAKDKITMLEGIETASALLSDIKNNPSKYDKSYDLDLAKAEAAVKARIDLAEKSGKFTADEIAALRGQKKQEPPKPATQVPFKPGYVPEPAAAEPAQGPAPVTDNKTWQGEVASIKAMRDKKDFEGARKALAAQVKDAGNEKEYNELSASIDKAEKAYKAGVQRDKDVKEFARNNWSDAGLWNIMSEMRRKGESKRKLPNDVNGTNEDFSLVLRADGSGYLTNGKGKNVREIKAEED
jgi:hypothetical protein